MPCRKALASILFLSCSLEVLLAIPSTPSAQELLVLDQRTRALKGDSVAKIWVYSLVGTDYDGYMMLSHFLAHYGSLGVPQSQFRFDLLHDTEEDDTGLKVYLLLDDLTCSD